MDNILGTVTLLLAVVFNKNPYLFGALLVATALIWGFQPVNRLYRKKK
ncbi:MAG: hypothetical protein LBN08_01200 [Lactobacillales bacterium]|jgi:hypothetical protein|nr:hypothetical protein [Lactobacillales bacterium]